MNLVHSPSQSRKVKNESVKVYAQPIFFLNYTSRVSSDALLRFLNNLVVVTPSFSDDINRILSESQNIPTSLRVGKKGLKFFADVKG